MSIIIRLQNLPWAANSVDIRRYFAGLSIPEGGVHIVGGEKGDAFIAFSTDEDARQAMEKDGGKIKDMRVKLLLSSRAEMMRVIEQARNQNVSSLQSSSAAPAVKASANDSDRRKTSDHGSSPRRREREKSPNRDRGSRRTTSRRDRSRSRSRSPRKSRDRDRERDMDRRSDRSKREDRRSDESQRSRDERPKTSRDNARDPMSDKKQGVLNSDPLPTQDKMPPVQGFSNSPSFGPMNVPSSQPYEHRPVPSDDNRSGIPFDPRHPGVPVSQHASFDMRMPSLGASGSPYNFGPSMSPSTGHSEKFDSKGMNDTNTSVPFAMKNSGDFHSSMDRRFGPVSQMSSMATTYGRARSPSASVAPSEFDKRLGPQNQPGSTFSKGFGMPGPYEKPEMHQTQQKDQMYDKPPMFGSQPFGNMNEYNLPPDRMNAPSAPYDRSAISLGQPAASVPPYAQKPAYGTEPPMGYEQIPASNLGSRSTASPGQMNEAGLYGKRLPMNIPTAVPPSSGTFDKVSRHSQPNQFEPDFIPPREGFYSGNSSENPHMSPNVPFGHTAPVVNKDSLNMPFGRSAPDGSRDNLNMPYGRSATSGNKDSPYDKLASQSHPMQGGILPPPREGMFGRNEESWAKQQPPHADVPRPGAWPDERQGLLQPPPLPPAKLGSFNQGAVAPKFLDEGASKLKGSPQNANQMKDNFGKPSESLQDSRRMHSDSLLDARRSHSDSMPEGRRPSDLVPEGRRPESVGDIRRPPDSMADARRPPSDNVPDVRRPPSDTMTDGRRPPGSIPDGRQPPDSMADGRRPNSLLEGRPHPGPMLDSRRHHPDSMQDGRHPDMMSDERSHPHSMSDGRRLHSDSMSDGRRHHIDPMPDGRRPHPDPMPDDRRPHHPDSMSDGRRPHSDTLESRRLVPDTFSNNKRPHPDSFMDSADPHPDSFPDRMSHPNAFPEGRRPQPESFPDGRRLHSEAGDRSFVDTHPDGRRPPLDSPYGRQENQGMNENFVGPPPRNKRDPLIREPQNTGPLLDRGEPPVKLSRGPPSLTVEIRSLPFDACDADVLELFRGIFIPPENMKLVHDSRGKPTGTAYVKFLNQRDYEEGLSRNQQYIGNSCPEVIPCPLSVFENAPGPNTQPSKGKGPPMNKRKMPFACEEDLIVELDGLPYSCKDDDIVHFFDGLRILDIFIERSPNGRASGVGYVEFGTPDDLKASLKMNRKMIGHRYITISISSKQDMLAARGNFGPASDEPHFEKRPPGRNRGPSHPSDDRASRAGPPGNKTTFCVSMSGLSDAVTNGDIADFFSAINIIPHAIHIMLDPNKIPTGEAFAEFVTVKEHETALQQNKKMLKGSSVTISPIPYWEMVDILGCPPPGPGPLPPPPLPPLLKNPPEEERSGRRPLISFPARPGDANAMGEPMHLDKEHDSGPEPFLPGRSRPPFESLEPPMSGRQQFSRMRGSGGSPRGSGRPSRPFSSERPPRGSAPFRGRGQRSSGAPQHIDSGPQNFGSPGCVIAISNLHFNAGLEELLDLFQGYSLNKDNIIRKYNDLGQPTSEARVAFCCPEDAVRAVDELNRKPVLGRPVILSLV